jgi:hypothetical protein
MKVTITTMLLAALLTSSQFVAADAGKGRPDLFNRADTNGNGLVDRSEYDRLNARIYERLDRNRDGLINENEPRRERGKRLFEFADSNNDKAISKSELQQLNRKRFQRMDSNDDGALSKQEIAQARERIRKAADRN